MFEVNFEEQLTDLLWIWFGDTPLMQEKYGETEYEMTYIDLSTQSILVVEFFDGPRVELIAQKSRDRKSLLYTRVSVVDLYPGPLAYTNLYEPQAEEKRSISIDTFKPEFDESNIGSLTKDDIHEYSEAYRLMLERDLSDLEAYESKAESKHDTARDCLVARFQEKLKCDNKIAGSVYDMWSSHSYDNLLDLVDSNIEPLFEAEGSTLNIHRENLSDFYNGVAKTSRATGLSISDVLTTLDFIEQIRPFNEVEESVIEPLVDLVKPYWPLSYSYETPTEGECCGEC